VSRPGKVGLKKLTVTIPDTLFTEIEQIVLRGERFISEVDFIRQAASDQVERWKKDHAGPEVSETIVPLSKKERK
jgi:Arc/MetJ-type ribon-helix-helix transcriptional regulator